MGESSAHENSPILCCNGGLQQSNLCASAAALSLEVSQLGGPWTFAQVCGGKDDNDSEEFSLSPKKVWCVWAESFALPRSSVQLRVSIRWLALGKSCHWWTRDEPMQGSWLRKVSCRISSHGRCWIDIIDADGRGYVYVCGGGNLDLQLVFESPWGFWWFLVEVVTSYLPGSFGGDNICIFSKKAFIGEMEAASTLSILKVVQCKDDPRQNAQAHDNPWSGRIYSDSGPSTCLRSLERYCLARPWGTSWMTGFIQAEMREQHFGNI